MLDCILFKIQPNFKSLQMVMSFRCKGFSWKQIFGKFGFKLWFVLQKHTVGYYFGGLFLQNFQWWSRTNCKKVRKTNLLKTRNFPLDIFRSSGVFYDNQLTKLIWRLEFYGSSSWKFQMPMKTQKKKYQSIHSAKPQK